MPVPCLLGPPTCDTCPQRATCCYSYGGQTHYACDGHDPTKQPGWLTCTASWSFTYRTLDNSLAVPHTTGHLGLAWPQ